MTRVMVIGNAGGGKSRLARKIAAVFGLPYHAVDLMQWRPGWEPVPKKEIEAAHAEILEAERWVIDGFGPWAAVETRLDAADTIVFVDYPFWRHLWWASKRQVVSLFVGRADGPPGCPMWRVTFRLYRMMWRIQRQVRPQLDAAIEARRTGARIIRLRSLADLQALERELAAV